MSLHRLLPTLLALTACAAPALAAEPGTELVPTRLDEPPTIDGLLDEPGWQSAARVEGFVQFEPTHGEPSPVATTVLIGYDDEALYFGFDCEDDDMARLAASITRRDGEGDRDDLAIVVLDTFQDGVSAYYFGANTLDTQFDGTVTNNGRTVDETWDAAWENASATSETGWTAEFRIPFAVLRYASGDDTTWGVQFMRIHPRRLETSVWAGPGEDEWRVSAFGALTGWSPPRSSAKWWQIVPYALGTYAEGLEGRDDETDGEIGGDIRLRYRSALIADLTLNPDFALVEADVEQINLTRFELFIPEKRPFFLEGSERWDQRIQQFYSRRIGDVDWGAKVTGTAAGFDYIALGTSGALEVEIEPPEEDLGGDPGEAEEEDDLTEILDADYGVLRLQRSFMGSSNIGLLAAGRDLADDTAGSVGLDTTLFFTEKIGMTAQYLQTHGPEGDGSENGSAWFVRPAWDTANSHFHIRYTNLDPGIRDNFNALGFLRDDNRREFDTNVAHTWWFQDSFFQKVRSSINYNRYYGHDGELRSYETRIRTRVDFSNYWGFIVTYEDEFQRFEEDFHNHIFELDFGWDNRAGRYWGIEISKGENFDDDLWLYEWDVTYKVSDKWNIGYEGLYLDLDPDLEDRSTTIHVLRTTYYFTQDLFLKLFAQTNERIDKENIQLTTVWRIHPPFGSLQFAYQRGTSAVGQESTQGDTVFVKFSWVF